jgi:hypothetical protein
VVAVDSKQMLESCAVLTFLREDVPVQSSEIILESVGAELEKLRRMAEQADNAVLMYLIDLAILEAKSTGSSVAEGEGSTRTGRMPLGFWPRGV